MYELSTESLTLTVVIASKRTARISVTAINTFVQVSCAHHAVANRTFAVNVICLAERLIEYGNPTIPQDVGLNCGKRIGYFFHDIVES